MRLIPKFNLDISTWPSRYHDPYWNQLVNVEQAGVTSRVSDIVEYGIEREVRPAVKSTVLGTLFSHYIQNAY